MSSQACCFTGFFSVYTDDRTEQSGGYQPDNHMYQLSGVWQTGS
jgi:hypothetical protein